jgi:hypothetical protein
MILVKGSRDTQHWMKETLTGYLLVLRYSRDTTGVYVKKYNAVSLWLCVHASRVVLHASRVTNCSSGCMQSKLLLAHNQSGYGAVQLSRQCRTPRIHITIHRYQDVAVGGSASSEAR